MESFHGKLRDECLNVHWFRNLWHARRVIAAWQREYNHERPHSSLGYQTPAKFAAAISSGSAAAVGLTARPTASTASAPPPGIAQKEGLSRLLEL